MGGISERVFSMCGAGEAGSCTDEDEMATTAAKFFPVAKNI